MKRLTTDSPSDNFGTMLNFVYGKDGWAHIRYGGENEDMLLTEWARKQCLKQGCTDVAEGRQEYIDEDISNCMMVIPECPVVLAYCFASQAVHLRSRLKMYEDILFAEDGTELASLDDLRGMIKVPANPPLTLEELREMDGEPVYVECLFNEDLSSYVVIDRCQNGIFTRLFFADFEYYEDEWLAYRRKPEEGMT